MENKVESPQDQMEISEAGTITADNISTSSASPTISNQAENECSNGIDTIAEIVSKNINSLQLTTRTTKNQEKENVENRNTLTLDMSQQNQLQAQKLTPVHHHPLMIDDDNESGDSCNNSHYESNFPDVVPAHHQPIRLPQPVAKSNATADVNSVNNNIATKSRTRPMYREPSPVSNPICADKYVDSKVDS